MFTKKANIAFNNTLFRSPTIALMHETMKRLYQAALALKGVSGKSKIAKLLDELPQALNNWERRGMSKGGMLKAENALGCSATWLMSGEGSMLASAAKDQPLAGTGSEVEFVPMPTRTVPLLNYVQAGGWSEVANPIEHFEAVEWLPVSVQVSRNAFALRVKGESMVPALLPDDFVIVDPDSAVRPGDFVVARNGEHEAMIKKYRLRKREYGVDVFDLVPLNPDFRVISSDEEDVTVIGPVIQIQRILRRGE